MKLIKTIDGIDIYFEALEENITLNELLPDHSDKELSEIYENNVIFCAQISAEKEGVRLAEEYLGGCIYENEEDFYTKYKDDYCLDMINTVLEQAKETILEEIKTIKQNHEKIRTILIEHNSPEFGDCIIDEICKVFNYPVITVYYED